MNNKNKIFLVKNFFNYEKILPVPDNLPEELITVYLTDNEETAKLAKDMGWDYSVVNTDYLNINDPMEIRRIIGKINAYPMLFISEIIKKHSVSFIFISDSNIISMWTNYKDFVDSCNSDKCLFVTSGYYSNYPTRNNIIAELNESAGVPRWKYNRDEMIECTKRYVTELELHGISYNDVTVVSAKYIGWNIKHPLYKKLSDVLYDEYLKNLQGNIILSYMAFIYKDYVNNYFCSDYSNARLSGHNFQR